MIKLIILVVGVITFASLMMIAMIMAAAIKQDEREDKDNEKY